MNNRLIRAAAWVFCALIFSGCALSSNSSSQHGLFRADEFRETLIEGFVRALRIGSSGEDDGDREYVDQLFSGVELKGDRAIVVLSFEDHPEGINFYLDGLKNGASDRLVLDFVLEKDRRNFNPFLYLACMGAVVEVTEPGTSGAYYEQYEKNVQKVSNQYRDNELEKPTEYAIETIGPEWTYIMHYKMLGDEIFFTFSAFPTRQ